tara:strand:- start:2691 stop:4313 length:1623 start_codon:yes stop_codon:yes gene_type:complete
MAIVVDMGGGQSDFEGALQGGLQGAASFAKGYQQAVDQTEEREELRRQRDRDAEKHELAIEQAARAQELIDAQEKRDIADWERDILDWERKREWGAQDRAQEEIDEATERSRSSARYAREQKRWEQQDEDRVLQQEQEKADRDFWENKRNEDYAWTLEQRALANKQLELTKRILIEEVAATEGEKRAAYAKLKNNRLALKWTPSDRKALERAFRKGGLDAGMSESERINARIRAQMDAEALPKIMGDPSTGDVGELERAYQRQDISDEDYQKAQEGIRAFNRGEGGLSPDQILTGLMAKQRIGRTRRAKQAEYNKAVPIAQAMWDEAFGQLDFDDESLSDEQIEAYADAAEALQELVDGTASDPGAATARSIMRKFKNAVNMARPLSPEQQQRVTETNKTLVKAKDQARADAARIAELEAKVADYESGTAPASTSTKLTPKTSAPSATVKLTGDSIKDLPEDGGIDSYDSKAEWIAGMRDLLKKFGSPVADSAKDDEVLDAYKALVDKAAEEAEKAKRGRNSERSQELRQKAIEQKLPGF